MARFVLTPRYRSSMTVSPPVISSRRWSSVSLGSTYTVLFTVSLLVTAAARAQKLDQGRPIGAKALPG
jgi:hypothetical protein